MTFEVRHSTPASMALWKDSSSQVKETAKEPVKDPSRDPVKDNLRESANEFAPNTEPAISIFNGTPAVLPMQSSTTPAIGPAPNLASELRTNPMTASVTPIRDIEQRKKESVITEELSIEGKIEGSGHVRIAGKFKGDVNVQGNLVIEQGAMVTGSVRASTVTIAGQLEGNIESATRVELLESGVLNGDVTADSLTVAAGSRMRGKADFGWTDKPSRTS